MENERTDAQDFRNLVAGISEEEAQNAVRTLLRYIGEDTEREGLVDTPKRYVKFLREFVTPKEFNFTTFENEVNPIDADFLKDKEGMEIIFQNRIEFHSLCEHHLAPFFGTACIAYIPKSRIVGLSKLARTVDFFARRPQNQERITKQVAQTIMSKLDAHGAICIIKAQHLCMAMRGVQKTGVETITVYGTGVFASEYQDPKYRDRFFDLYTKNI
jgi:GTP cyclohydrolase IA